MSRQLSEEGFSCLPTYISSLVPQVGMCMEHVCVYQVLPQLQPLLLQYVHVHVASTLESPSRVTIRLSLFPSAVMLECRALTLFCWQGAILSSTLVYSHAP